VAATRSSKAQYLPDPAVGPKNREQAHPPKEDLNEVRPDRRARPRSFARSIAKAKRHCVGADGSEISDAGTKKQCKKAGGKWRKMTASTMAK